MRIYMHGSYRGLIMWLMGVMCMMCAGVSTSQAGTGSSEHAQIAALKSASQSVHVSQQRSIATALLPKLKVAHDAFEELHSKEDFKDDLLRSRATMLEEVNWSKRYQKIELMSQAKTLDEVTRLLVTRPVQLSQRGSPQTMGALHCAMTVSDSLWITGPLVWFRTARVNIYVHQQWAGASGLFWTVCDRKTERLLRAPTSESGCSSGAVYRKVGFKEYLREQTPFLEARDGGCRGHDPHYETLYDLERDVKDVEGSVYSYPARYHASLRGETTLFTWHVPGSKGYDGYFAESWSSKGERQWKRKMVVQIQARDDHDKDRVCEDKEKAKKYGCLDGRVPDPVWTQSCRMSAKTREVQCRKSLKSKAPAAPFLFDEEVLSHHGSSGYYEAALKLYDLRLEGVDELRSLGYDISESVEAELRARRKLYADMCASCEP